MNWHLYIKMNKPKTILPNFFLGIFSHIIRKYVWKKWNEIFITYFGVSQILVTKPIIEGFLFNLSCGLEVDNSTSKLLHIVTFTYHIYNLSVFVFPSDINMYLNSKGHITLNKIFSFKLIRFHEFLGHVINTQFFLCFQ